eukprot:11996384-Ditylum_brightwellii.AAC.1
MTDENKGKPITELNLEHMTTLTLVGLFLSKIPMMEQLYHEDVVRKAIQGKALDESEKKFFPDMYFVLDHAMLGATNQSPI